MLFKAVLIGPGCEMWSMDCRFICFSQHYAIIEWAYPDLLAPGGILSDIFFPNLFKFNSYQVSFSPLIKPDDFAWVPLEQQN